MRTTHAERAVDSKGVYQFGQGQCSYLCKQAGFVHAFGIERRGINKHMR